MGDSEDFEIMNEEIDNSMTEQEYFFEVFDTISDSVISDEYFDKNAELLSVALGMLYDIDQRTGGMSPEMARRVLEGIFSSILKIGIR